MYFICLINWNSVVQYTQLLPQYMYMVNTFHVLKMLKFDYFYVEFFLMNKCINRFNGSVFYGPVIQFKQRR